MSDLFNLKDKNVLLFGGSGILGKEFSKSLIAHNANLISCDIKDLDESLKLDGVDYQVLDASNEEELISFKDKIIAKYKKIDVISASR